MQKQNNGANIMQRPRLLTQQLICGDYLNVAALMEPDSVDLVFGSPPYEDARTYGIDFKLKGQDWVDWMVEVIRASLRISKGLVAFVVQGKTKKFRWSATPALLMADLHRAGIHLRDCAFYHRMGIPGSAGPDWLRHDVEYIVCATNGGRLPWSDNTAMGHPCKYAPGGEMSHRMRNGKRINGKMVYEITTTDGYRNGDCVVKKTGYSPPKLANPGNLIHCDTGGGRIGSKLAHENEAPFPEKLAEFFIKSFCPPGGVVLDPFGGSGTSASVATQNGRGYISVDIRQSQIELTQRRLND